MDEPPNIRQKLLRDVVSERRPDTFFSLHRVGAGLKEKPIYISEVKESSMNPDFKFFSLAEYRQFSRDDSVLIRIWSNIGPLHASTLIVEGEVYLPSLIRVGKTVRYLAYHTVHCLLSKLDTFYHPLGDNTIIFHMTDGVYASFSDLPDVESVLNSVHAQPPTPRSATLMPRDTSSYDTLMKLKDLAECVEDAENTRNQVSRQIEQLIRENKAAGNAIASATQKVASVKSVKDSLEKTKRLVQRLREENDARQAGLQSRRAAIDSQETKQRTGEAELGTSHVQLREKRSQQTRIKADVTGQVRRIAQTILSVFPIEPIKGYSLCFTIRDHFLPSARIFEPGQAHSDTQPSSSETGTAAALGYVVRIILMLQDYLMITLPYLPGFCGSTSTIFDPLSSAHELGISTSSSASRYRLDSYVQASSPSQEEDEPEKPLVLVPPTPVTHPFRTFPLYQQSTPPKRFRWAIYLLNRDIEELMQQSGCVVMDARNTLANLKFLLTVLASGKGDMPGRKVGVIRGLEKR